MGIAITKVTDINLFQMMSSFLWGFWCRQYTL